MVEHKYISTEINKKPVETVYELKGNEYKVPSFEEFMKDYDEKERVSDNYQSEFDSYGDLRVKGTYYGPGFWDDIKDVVKPVAKGVLIVGFFFPPTAPFVAPIAVTVAAVGATTYGIGHINDDKDWKEVGSDLFEIGSDSFKGRKLAGESGAAPRLV